MKFLIITSISIFLWGVSIAAEYRVPQAAWSVSAADIDQDGDMDIVIGHSYSQNIEWTGLSILYNNDTIFAQPDSLYLNGEHQYLCFNKFDDNSYWDLVTQCYNDTNSQLCINYDFYNITSNKEIIDLESYANAFEGGDIDADGDKDIVFISNSGQFWGWMYNEGNGSFSEPHYQYYNENYPSDIACGDINGDGRADVGVSAQTTRVYFSYPDSFKAVILEENFFKDNIIFADMNKDGRKDVVTSVSLHYGLTENIIFEYAGGDSFYTRDKHLFSPSLYYLEICDVNNDSLPDMIYTGLDGIYVLYNEGDFILSDPEFFPIPNYGETWRKSFCADFDGNGFKDVVTVRTIYEEIPSNVNILFNDGTGRFQDTSPVGIDENKQPKIPQEFSLSNFPNPFNNSTTIQFSLKNHTKVNLEIYNTGGQLINQLIQDKTMAPGRHTIAWQGRNSRGVPVSSGIYVVVLHTEESISTKKILLMK